MYTTVRVPDSSPPLLTRSRAGTTALAAMTPIGPLLMAGWAFAVPYEPTDDIAASIVKLAGDPVGVQLSLTFLLLAAVFGSAGSLVVGAGVRRGAPRLGAIATVLAFTGFVIAAYPGPLAAVAASRAAGMSEVEVAPLVAAIDAQLQGMVVNALFVSLPAGILLLGIAALVAALRSQAYPRWAAVLLASAIPVVLVCGFISSAALGAAWVLVAGAYGAGGWAYTRAASRTMIG